MNLIGLDIGTTTICGVLYSLDEKKTVKTLVRDNSFINSAHAGEYVQDPGLILKKVREIMDELIDFTTDEIGGCSLSAQMHGILYVDDQGMPLSPYYTWQNKRGLKEEDGQPLENFLSEKLGYPVYSGYGIVTHYSLMREGQVPERAAKFCNIGDFVCMRLAGEKTPVTDLTLGASMGIADLATGGLSAALKNLDLTDDSLIPAIVPSTHKLGEYRGIPVIQPLGDNQASFLGSVREKESSLLINYGTAGQISFYRKDYASYPHFETRPLGNEGFIHAAFSLCGGHSYKIMAGFFEAAAKLFAPGGELNAMAVMDSFDLDFSEQPIDCLPLFLGERGGEGQTAFFRNITDGNFTPENMVRALVQGMANELYRFHESLPEELHKSIRHLIGAGNGIRKNRHLIKAAQLRYNMPLSLLDLKEESCMGALINAGKGSGIFRDYAEGAAAIVKYSS